ncbi:lycopene cyclase family protein, partial [Serratia marcescens]
YYSDTPEFDAALLGRRIDAYADAQGWQVDRVVREEGGALPVVMGGDFEAYWQAGGNKVAKAGARAGLFH